jgi:hypothetical protein
LRISARPGRKQGFPLTLDITGGDFAGYCEYHFNQTAYSKLAHPKSFQFRIRRFDARAYLVPVFPLARFLLLEHRVAQTKLRRYLQPKVTHCVSRATTTRPMIGGANGTLLQLDALAADIAIEYRVDRRVGTIT